MSNFDIFVEMNVRTDKRNDEHKKGMPMSQRQEVREMFHARFDGFLVL